MKIKSELKWKFVPNGLIMLVVVFLFVQLIFFFVIFVLTSTRIINSMIPGYWFILANLVCLPFDLIILVLFIHETISNSQEIQKRFRCFRISMIALVAILAMIFSLIGKILAGIGEYYYYYNKFSIYTTLNDSAIFFLGLFLDLFAIYLYLRLKLSFMNSIYAVTKKSSIVLITLFVVANVGVLLYIIGIGNNSVIPVVSSVVFYILFSCMVLYQFASKLLQIVITMRFHVSASQSMQGSLVGNSSPTVTSTSPPSQGLSPSNGKPTLDLNVNGSRSVSVDGSGMNEKQTTLVEVITKQTLLQLIQVVCALVWIAMSIMYDFIVNNISWLVWRFVSSTCMLIVIIHVSVL